MNIPRSSKQHMYRLYKPRSKILSRDCNQSNSVVMRIRSKQWCKSGRGRGPVC